MANFQAAFNIVDATASACWLQISDTSNYATNTQAQHQLSKFTDYIKVTVIRPDSTEYCYSSINDCNVDILPPATSIFNGVYNFLQTDINGTYTVRLCSVPSYEVGISAYSSVTNDVVYHNGTLWAATTPTSGGEEPSPISTEWVEITEEQLEASYPQYCVEQTTVVSCLPSIAFQQRDADINVNDACTSLAITDGGNYAGNDEAGHSLADFTDYRKVTLIRPDKSEYVYSSLNDGDELIGAPSAGNFTFNYPFLESDTDGIYEVRVCAYPTYDNAVSYDLTPEPEVVYDDIDGNLYKNKVDANVGNQPSTSPDEWELYEPTVEEELTTRYCTSYKMVVLCISILSCRETLIHQAFCAIESDFCNDDILCKNTKFLNAMKLRTLLDAMKYSVDKSAWNEVERQVNLAKTICNC